MSDAKETRLSTNNPQKSTGPKDVLRYLLLSFIYVGTVYAASELPSDIATFTIAVLGIIISVPIMAAYGYQAAIRRTYLIHVVLKCRSKAKALLSGFLFRIIASFILSALTSSYMILSIIDSYGPGWYLWVSVGASVPLMLATYEMFRRILRDHIKDFICNSYSMIGASLMVSLLLTVFFSVATNYGSGRPLYDSYWSALDAQLTYGGSNLIVGLFFELYRFSSAVNDFGLSILQTTDGVPGVWYYSVYILNTFLFFLGFTSAISVFLVGPKAAISRIFAEPCGRVDSQISLGRRRRLLALTATVSLVGVYFYLFFGVSSTAERIGENLVLVGTIERIRGREERHRAELRDFREDAYATAIEPEIRAAFETVRGGVPGFLDWYYGLPADLGRLPLAIVGQLEQRFRDKMMEHLLGDDPFSDLTAKMEVLDEVERMLNDRVRREVDQMVVERAINPPAGVELTVSRSMSESDIVALFEIEAIPLDVRFGVALGTGVVVGVTSGIVGSKIASKIVSRAMAKGTIKRAAGVIVSAVARALGARAGAAGGAVAGGVSGAAVAGPVGSAVGAVAGVATALAVDFGLLKLEEYLSRDELEREILEVIAVAEREVMLEAERLLIDDTR